MIISILTMMLFNMVMLLKMVLLDIVTILMLMVVLEKESVDLKVLVYANIPN